MSGHGQSHNPWIQFEKQHQGEMSREELSRAYQQQKTQQEQQGGQQGGGQQQSGGGGGRSQNPWIEFEKQHHGEMTREELSRAYQQQKSQQGSGQQGDVQQGGSQQGGAQQSGGGQGQNPWIEFEKQHQGEMSREELSRAYQQQKAQQSGGGGAQQSGGSQPSGGQQSGGSHQPEQLKAWTEFEKEHGGQGLSRHQMAREFHHQQQQK